ncbi:MULTISPECIES: efflux RND transporter periplasmic adaptor subunit [Pelosinus]|uniref:Efflux transporter, RND family, MFP subunit n=1 Tax=Pelosinus fermentans B4 TaxID=1149862 RepID=I9L9H9_9FIRM|nr:MULTISPECIES: efflux RND transporter periplasmic adaptor subunit [Pelosinus]EIW17054.1 efflux transporter, RND family, MFP subunit [Pelosinus fermentans B4]EIW23147.1 efflux transporter, RND family, MFP subunit [Pelosinus fermentans A11]OAM93810.1 efflux transporter, RND family, MFP subunit [Pelosinus fermentans DSM 17108]SDQ90890.1 HlyD family secretion protein [Pelosinus fermentans]
MQVQTLWQKRYQYKKIILLIIIVGVAATFGIRMYVDKSKPVVTTQLVAVERGDIVSLVSATGTINPVNIVDISSKITGLIKEVRVLENEQVKAGQILILLDDKRLMAQVSQSRAKLENTSANYQRNLQLNRIGAISNQQLDASIMDYSVAQATYDDAVSQLDDTVIKAPIDGVIIGKPIPAGQTVAPGISTPMVLMSVADLSKMQIEAQVDESDIGKIALGQRVTFTVDAYIDKVFSGTVSNISQKANITQNVVYYVVTIDVEGPGTMLKPTMTARVSIQSGESKNTILVPLSAIKENQGQPYVQIMVSGKIENINVTTGLSNEDKVEITSGLADGDQIVLPQAKALPQASGNMRGPLGR